MDFEDQKKYWQEPGNAEEEKWMGQHLRRVWTHPSLRYIRRELIVETVAWVLFLFLYYSALDGALRPFGWNFAMVIALVLLIVHGLMGYHLASKPVSNAPLLVAMRERLKELTNYSWISVSLQTGTLVIIMGFLLSTVTALWETPKVWLFGTMVIWLIIAFGIQVWIWRYRLGQLRKSIEELEY
jgi:vacuolar-type H+-ATPase subunit I/STV1